MGGYQHLHGRPPAFGAADGHAYSVATFTDEAADGNVGAALLFVRWGDGERPMGHLETDYLGFGKTADEALAPLLALTLEQVKAHLDTCVERQRA